MSRETKTLSFQVKATGESTVEGQEFGHIEAYTAIFNNVDEGNDRILPGAFTRTIQNSKTRAKSRGKKYVLPMLWNHDPAELIGGWTDMTEDGTGLKCRGDVSLATQRGREYYALAKVAMSDEFSIVYDIPTGGAKYDKSGVRELGELRLFSCDPVTFAMNDATYMVGVKSRLAKAITGNTSGTIGPRDEAWDGSKAEKQIWAVAAGDDGTVKVATAKKYFMVMDDDGSKKGDWHYPFWYVGDSPHICVGAVITIGKALAGSRGANPPDGLKSKVETLYERINKKYPDDNQLSLDDGKGNRMNRQLKTLLEHYNEEMAEDLLEDWQDVFISALTCAVFDAFTIGDQPAQDISQALDDFKEVVLSKFVTQGIEVGLSEYLENNAYSYTPGLSRMQNGSDDDGKYSYGYMSRSTRMQRKAGRAISAENQSNIDDHVAGLHDLANQATKAMKTAMQQMKAVHTAADDFASTMQGAEAAYGSDPGDPGEGQQEGKRLELEMTAALKGLRELH